ncbi:short chain dehydrogenase/reductase [Thecamonas trahens ATCC 50062]|uniref:Short chain dehydrogenase/reductase n=1 Tax=Thecamonas trahens ATCC 50062 TaxID=461836 RepID=A0A0L0DGG8_THETB|nr:short chain dehydrogenase/reductase [Thecamonas trahens ATCC 50062]KNC51427.1 short chain dehydrogenase/reductase [Thecamonas trahens ATCC 50062]|eukprot:XP_013756091.1 short chain dehydrogenase/reductase [Thecamonas trahens ATCC 50062]
MATRRLAIVTGSNQGIGLEAVKQLAAAGLDVILTSRSEEKGRAAAEEASAAACSADAPGSITALQLDITDTSSVAAFTAAVEQLGRPVDVLVNNAGMAYKGDAFGPDEAAATLAVNLYGTKALTDAVRPLLAPASARIINVASRAGRISQTSGDVRATLEADDLTWDALHALAQGFVTAIATGNHKELGYSGSMYGMSKACEIAYSRILARELDGNVTVVWMCPGYCSTSMSSYRGTKSAAEGADTITWLATVDPAPASATFYAERTAITWDTKL